jgi:predicted RNA-binding Zn ribbon-like protein
MNRQKYCNHQYELQWLRKDSEKVKENMAHPTEISIPPTANLGDHPVLEFLNTVPLIDGQLQDLVQSDADVLATLDRIGFPATFHGTGLLTAARTLREDLRSLITARKAGNQPNPKALVTLNKFLRAASSYLELTQPHPDQFALEKVWSHQTPEQALAPVAESAADLLATGDFHLIRRCESDACVLWFYDRTKSHHRRWCSMASCGNRAKVAAFRQRRSEA